MLAIFFQKGEKIQFIQGQTYLRVTNNLDSHHYVLERIKQGTSEYIHQNYFQKNHPQVVSYYTSWKQKEIIIQEVPLKKIQKKKGIMGGLLNKKSRTDVLGKVNPQKEVKEQVVTTIQDVLYIQVQSFSELIFPQNSQQIKQMMALIYLLASKIKRDLKELPKMIPVMTDSRKYKFIKKGANLQTELVRLFNFITKQSNNTVLMEWSQQISNQIEKIEQVQQKISFLGQFLQKQIKEFIAQDFNMHYKKGNELLTVTVKIQEDFSFLMKQLKAAIKIEQYEVTYYHQDTQNRQIVLEHNYLDTMILQGPKQHFIIRYLKQFVNN